MKRKLENVNVRDVLLVSLLACNVLTVSFIVATNTTVTINIPFSQNFERLEDGKHHDLIDMKGHNVTKFYYENVTDEPGKENRILNITNGSCGIYLPNRKFTRMEFSMYLPFFPNSSDFEYHGEITIHLRYTDYRAFTWYSVNATTGQEYQEEVIDAYTEGSVACYNIFHEGLRYCNDSRFILWLTSGQGNSLSPGWKRFALVLDDALHLEYKGDRICSFITDCGNFNHVWISSTVTSRAKVYQGPWFSWESHWVHSPIYLDDIKLT